MRRILMFVAMLLMSSVCCAQDVYTNSEGKQCDLDGTATSDKGKKLNEKKNRYASPTAADFDANVNLAAMLAPGDDVDRFDDSKGAAISGFVVDVKKGGIEDCNCKATKPIDCDTHIELALAEDAPTTQRVIVEVTPRLRAMMGNDWTTEALADPDTGIKGKWIEVSGWLLFDVMHVNEAENTNPGDDRNWRATCWEIHPITNLKKLPAAPPQFHGLHPELLRTFHRMQAASLDRNADAKTNLKARNAKLLEGFDKDELEVEKKHP
jgi:hypothetical protein